MSQTHNVDPAEIAKFEELASRWWDTENEFKPLHDINPLRLNYITQGAGGIEGKRVLDVGCGGGILTESLAIAGANATGIDMGEAPLNVARLHALDAGVEVDYLQTPVEQFADENPEQFDVVCCMEMLEHVPDPASVVQACQKLVKPDGHIFFSTINRNAKAFLFAIVGAEYLMRMLPKGTHEYNKFIRPSEMARFCRQAALHIEDISGMSYNPLTKDYRLDNDLNVNYLMHCRRQ